MDELQQVLDAVAGEELSGRFGSQLLPRLRGLLAARNRLDAEIARTVRECEGTQASEIDGLTTMASWLRGHARLSAGAAAGVVRAGRALAELPAVAAAAAAGAVTAEQVAAISPVTRPENVAAAEAQGVDVVGVDAALAEVAATRPYAELRQVVSHYLARLDPDGAEPDPTEGRSLAWARHPDGAVSGRLELDAVGGEKLITAIEAVVQAGRCADDERSRAQQNADALVQLADNALASGGLPVLRTVKPHVVVTVRIEDLVDPGTGPGEVRTGLGATISAARARLVACDGAVTRIVFGPAGQPLDLGRTGHSAGARRELASGGGRSGPLVRRLRRPQPLVRGPPPAALGRRRRDRAGEPGAALRTPPHQGPPRVHRPPRSPRPMAHPPPRRHRDPHRGTPGTHARRAGRRTRPRAAARPGRVRARRRGPVAPQVRPTPQFAVPGARAATVGATTPQRDPEQRRPQHC